VKNIGEDAGPQICEKYWGRCWSSNLRKISSMQTGNIGK